MKQTPLESPHALSPPAAPWEMWLASTLHLHDYHVQMLNLLTSSKLPQLSHRRGSVVMPKELLLATLKHIL